MLAAALFCAAACTPVERAMVPADAGGELVEIEANAQATVEGLRIGLGYVRKADAAASGGAAGRGLVAGLWLYFRDEPGKNQSLDASAGQRISAAGYSIFVEELRGGRKASVRLRVQAPIP